MGYGNMIDFTSAAISFKLIYPEIFLLMGAAIVLISGCFQKTMKFSSGIAFITMIVSLIFAAGQWNDQQSGFFGMVSCDNFGVAFKVIFLGTSILTLFIAHRFLLAKGIDHPEFYALLLISTLGMMVMVNTTDLVVMFLGLEIMSIPLYVMAALARRSLESNEAGIKYFIMGAFASAFLLMGIAFVFGASGTTDLRLSLIHI